MRRRKEEYVLVNDPLITCYGIGHVRVYGIDHVRVYGIGHVRVYGIGHVRVYGIGHVRVYGIGHVVKDYTDREIGKTMPPFRWLLFPISSNRGFYMHHPTDVIVRTVIPVVEHWLVRDIAQWNQWRN